MSAPLSPSERTSLVAHVQHVREMERMVMEQLAGIRRELQRCSGLLTGSTPTPPPAEKPGFVVLRGGR
jgi:hypothetical protein